MNVHKFQKNRKFRISVEKRASKDANPAFTCLFQVSARSFLFGVVQQPLYFSSIQESVLSLFFFYAKIAIENFTFQQNKGV